MDPNSFYYDDNSDGSSSGGGLFGQVLGAVTQLGATAILANGSSPNTNVPYPGPNGSYNAGSVYGAPPKAGMSFLTILFLAVVGFFAFTRLGK